MALAFTLRGTFGATTNASSYSESQTWTPGADSYVLAIVCVSGSARIASSGTTVASVGSFIYGPSDAIGADQAIEARVLAGALDDLVLYLRYDGNGSLPTAYTIQALSTGVVLRIINAGSNGSSLTSGTGVSANDLVRAEIVGTTVSAYLNGVSLFSYDVAGDTPLLTTGTVAWRYDRTIDGAADDLKVEEYVAGQFARPISDVSLGSWRPRIA